VPILLLVNLSFLSHPVMQLVVSLIIGVAVALIILALFNQGGEVKLSPQRAAAIATGHSDRRTVFEYPQTRPILWMLLKVSHSMRLPGLKDWIRRKLVASGNPNYYTPEEYLALSLLSGLVTAATLELVDFMITGTPSIFLPIMGLVVGFALSLVYLSEQAGLRMRTISKRLPYALDLISLAMGAGATFGEAAATIVDESSESEDDPLNVELRAMLAEMELGATRRRALENLARRVPLSSMQGLVASVKQAEQLGTPLSDMLGDQAELMRLNRSTRAEDRAAKASIRILVPCLLLVAAVILVVFGPMVIRYVRDGLF
jgi:tight adherence protein C